MKYIYIINKAVLSVCLFLFLLSPSNAGWTPWPTLDLNISGGLEKEVFTGSFDAISIMESMTASAADECDFKIGVRVEPITHISFSGIDTALNSQEPLFESEATGVFSSGQTYLMELEGKTVGIFRDYFTAFFDWNGDGSWVEAIEIGSIADSDGYDGKKASLEISIPNVAPGIYKMRVIKDQYSYPSDPCGTYGVGQAVDFNINVTGIVLGIAAYNDNFELFAGENTASVLNNDMLNGQAPQPYEVNLTGTNVPSGMTINPDGTISVDESVLPDTYTFEYTICTVGGSGACDSATVTLTVLEPMLPPVLVAMNDDFGEINVDLFTPSIFNNDTINGESLVSSQVTVSFTNGVPAGLSINNNGVIYIEQDALPGHYEFEYTICSADFPDICSTATVTLTVLEPEPEDTIVATDDNFDEFDPGMVTPSVLDNDTLNDMPIDPDLVAIFHGENMPSYFIINPNGGISIDPDTPAGYYEFEYTVCLMEGSAVCDTAVVSLTVKEMVDCHPGPAEGDPLKSGIGIMTKASQTDTSKSPNWPEDVPNGYLVLDAAEKGMVLSYVANPETDIVNPVEGMLVYNTELDCVQMYRGLDPKLDSSRKGWNCLEDEVCPVIPGTACDFTIRLFGNESNSGGLHWKLKNYAGTVIDQGVGFIYQTYHITGPVTLELYTEEGIYTSANYYVLNPNGKVRSGKIRSVYVDSTYPVVEVTEADITCEETP